MIGVVKWEEPPKVRRIRRDWALVADTLRQNPGKWGLVAEDISASTVTFINTARLAAFEPAGSFEATAVGSYKENRTRVNKVYARFVGESTDERGL